MVKFLVLAGLITVQCDTWQVMDLPELEEDVEILQTSRSFRFDEAKAYCDEQGGQLPVPDSVTKNEDILKLTEFLNVYKQPTTGKHEVKMQFNTATKKSKLSHRQNVIWLGLKRVDNLNWRNIYTNKRIGWGNWATVVKECACHQIMFVTLVVNRKFIYIVIYIYCSILQAS